MQALAKQTAYIQRVKDTHRFLLLKCHNDPAINAEHIGMNKALQLNIESSAKCMSHTATHQPLYDPEPYKRHQLRRFFGRLPRPLVAARRYPRSRF